MAKIKSEERVIEYSKEFKVRVVRLSYIEGIQIKQISEGLGLHPFMVSRWRKEYRDGKLVSEDSRKVVMGLDKKSQSRPSPQTITENERLRSENARLKRENDLLKKWQRYLAEVRQSDSASSSGTEKS
ncbi:MAG: transposase [Gammaproteobacteria bacterium]|nr:transposase [Gammaproteobacteria bacterium]